MPGEPRELECAFWLELVRWRWWWLSEELREEVEPEASGSAWGECGWWFSCWRQSSPAGEEVFVPEIATPDWQLLRCTRIEITRSNATKTTISQSCVVFLLQSVLNVESKQLHAFLELVF